MFWVPRRTIVCDKVLADQGLTGDVLVEALSLDWVPLERDLLSLELDTAFRVRCDAEIPVRFAELYILRYPSSLHCLP